MQRNHNRGRGRSNGGQRSREDGVRDLVSERQRGGHLEAGTELTRHVGTHISPTEDNAIVSLTSQQQPHLLLDPRNAQFAPDEHYRSDPGPSYSNDQGVVRQLAEATGRYSPDIYMSDAQNLMPSSIVHSEGVFSYRASDHGTSEEMSLSSNASSQHTSSSTGYTRSMLTQGSRSSSNSRVGSSWPRYCCLLPFSSTKLLERHYIRYHAGKKPCEWCGKPLKYRKDNFDRHLKACKFFHGPWPVDAGPSFSPWSVSLETHTEEEEEEETIPNNADGQFALTSLPYRQSNAAPYSPAQNDFNNGQIDQNSVDFQRLGPRVAEVFPDPTLSINPYRGPGLARQVQFSSADHQHNTARSNPLPPGEYPNYAVQNAQPVRDQSFYTDPLRRATLRSLDHYNEMYGRQLPLDMQNHASQQYGFVGGPSQAPPTIPPSDNDMRYGDRAPRDASIYGRQPASRSAPAQSEYRKPEMPASDSGDEEDADCEDDDYDDDDQ